MKNLIEEIEKTLQDTERIYRHTSEVYNGYLKSHYRGKMEAYMSILQSLKDYNIITAPKSIKLSEIVERLEKDFPTHNFYYDYNKKWIAIWLGNFCYATFEIEDNKLVLENKDNFEYPKWLYTLWITETEIIDDLKEEK